VDQASKISRSVLLTHLTADIRGTAHWEAVLADPGEGGATELMRLTPGEITASWLTGAAVPAINRGPG